MFFAISAYANGIASLAVALIVYLKKRDTHLGKLFLALTLSIGCWSILLANVVISSNIHQAVLWAKLEHIAVALIPAVALHFCLGVIQLDIKRKPLLLSAYIFSALLILSLPTGLFENGVREIAGLKYYIRPGPLYIIYFLFYVICFTYAGYSLLKSYLAQRHSRVGRQALFVFWASFLGSGAGLASFLPVYGFSVLPALNCLVVLYVIALAYAILRHGLLDISVLIKKTLVFAGLFASVFAIVGPVTFVLQGLLGKFVLVNNWISIAISIVFLILLYDPLKIFLVKVTDKYLFQKKHDTRQFLRSFIDYIVTVLDLNKIISGTVELLVKTFHPEKIAILLLDDDSDQFVSQQVIGYDRELIIEKKSAIPAYLISSKDIFSIEGPNNTNAHKDLLAQMKEYYAHLEIPLLIHDELIGFILLGKKKSDEYYTVDELSVLSDLAKTEAIAISNSKTHALLLQAQQREEQSNRLLSLAYLVTNLSHELRNPLNLISGCAKVAIDTVAFRAKDLPRDEGYQSILSLTVKKHTEIMEISKKASDMLNAILNSMKIDKSKFVPVDLRNVVHEAMKRADVDAHSANIKLLNKIPHNFTKINGDYITLEQVFFNLIHNAVEAMVRNGKGDRVEISAVDMSKKIKIEIADNGPGIPKHDLERIFEPFYTTKDNLYKYTTGQSKGAGLGLTIVNNNVKSHGGIVHVESEEGKGTTFVVEIPKDGGVSNG